MSYKAKNKQSMTKKCPMMPKNKKYDYNLFDYAKKNISLLHNMSNDAKKYY